MEKPDIWIYWGAARRMKRMNRVHAIAAVFVVLAWLGACVYLWTTPVSAWDRPLCSTDTECKAVADEWCDAGLTDYCGLDGGPEPWTRYEGAK